MLPPSVRELRKQCRAAGLDAGGEMQDLVDRLREYEDEGFCDAVLATRSMIAATEDEIKQNAINPFERTIQEAELEVRRERGDLYVGNPRGLGLVGLPERVRILEEQEAARTEREMDKDAEVASLKEEVSELKASLHTLKLATLDYKRIIRSGNVSAHQGEAPMDALLYEYGSVGSRPDFFVFVDLYGMNPQEVMKITHEETIKILNLHATVRANTQQKANPEFYAKFKTFVNEFQRSGHAVDYIVAEPTANPTRAAYDALLQCPPYEKTE